LGPPSARVVSRSRRRAAEPAPHPIAPHRSPLIMPNNAYLQGIQGAYDNQAQIRNDISVVAINWFANRCPLVTRTPRVPVVSPTFTMVNRNFRSRVAQVAAPIAATDTQITLVDASPFMNGDVLELASGERVEILADPNIVTNVVTVRRGAEGTTPA